MEPFPHQYEVNLAGGPAGSAYVFARGIPALGMAPPREFGGPGDAWSPEHLLLASVQACFLFTLRAVAQRSAVEFTHLDVAATGTVDRQDHVTRFTEIVLHATVTVPPGVDRERVLQLLERSKKACLVSASLSTPVLLDTEIHQAASAPEPVELAVS